MSETIEVVNTVPNIYQKIVSVMSELHYIAKGDKMVNGQYRFVSHDQVTAKVHPLLVKYGIVIVPSVEEMFVEGNRFTAKLLICFVNSECPSDNFTVRYVGQGIDSGDKGAGKAISYAYKYALLKTFCLETGDDPDNNANASYEPAKCLEFETEVANQFTGKDKAKLKKFLVYCSEVLEKHVEDVKREAVKRPADFIAKFNVWNPTKPGDKNE